MKKTLLAIALASTAVSSFANAAWTSPDGSLTIGGDAEINLDLVHNKYGTKNEFNPADNDNTKVQLNDDSRIKLAVQWLNEREDGAYVTARIEPLIRTDGTVKVDDAYFMFGREDSWAFQIGRYEAMNLFPLGKDVAVFYADGSDAIGGGIYYYMAKEARGRRDTAGQARLIGEMGNWTAEVSTVYGNTADLLGAAESNLDTLTSDEDNDLLESSNNSFMIRPAINYLSDSGDFSISFGGEYETNGDSVTLKSGLETGEVYDLSKRYGLSATTTLVLSNNLLWNTSIAMQDAKEAWDAQTFNTNIIYGNFGLGVSAAINNFKNKTINYGTQASPDRKDAEDAKSYVLYTAYTMPILDFENAEVTFALSYSETKNAYGIDGNNEDTTAFRTRFNYYF